MHESNGNGTPRIDGVKLTPETTAVHIKQIHDSLEEIKATLEADYSDLKSTLVRDYVTKAEFNPVRAVVYGLVGVLMIAVVSGLMATIITAGRSVP
jgi:hypothetical protein